MLRVAHLLGAGLLILWCFSAAEARHYRYYWGYPWFGYAHDKAFGRFGHDKTPDIATREADPCFLEKPSGSTLGRAIDQLTGVCDKEVTELRKLPVEVESVSRTPRPDNKQGAALESLRQMADEAANTLAANCPKDIEPAPSGRLDALDRSLDAVEAALDKLQPLLQTLYRPLRDEQKVAPATSGIARGKTSHQETSRARVRSRSRVGDDREARGEVVVDQPREAQAPSEWNCEQWGAELRAWPVARVEEIVQPGPRQRAAFYELAASFQHAADQLADTCPSQPATALMTAPERIAQIRNQLDAVRQSIVIVRPTIARFDEMLDAVQRKRFRDAM
jgi:hypothetical protein